MAKFLINYRMTCNGSVEVEAETQAEANALAKELPASDLGREAEDVEVEIVSED